MIDLRSLRDAQSSPAAPRPPALLRTRMQAGTRKGLGAWLRTEQQIPRPPSGLRIQPTEALNEGA